MSIETAPAPESAPTAVAESPASNPAVESTTPEGGFGSSLDAFFDGPEAVAPTVLDAQTPASDNPIEGETPATESGVETPEGDPLDGVEGLDSVDELKDWTPNAARRFRELKTEAKASKMRQTELEDNLTQRENRVKELEALVKDPATKETAERGEEYERAMLLNDLEGSPAFKNLVTAPLERITQDIDALAEKYSVSGDDLIDLVVMSDEAEQEEMLGELMADASDRDKFKLYKLIEDTKPVLAQRAMLHENASEALAEIKELDTQRETLDLADRVKVRSEAAGEIAKRVVDKLPFVASFDNVNMAELTKYAADTDFTKLSPAVGTYQAMAGKLLPAMATQYMALQTELGVLTGKLAEYAKTGSPLNGGSAGAPVVGGSSSKTASFTDAVEAAFR